MSIAEHPFCYSELHTDDPAGARAFYGELFAWPMSTHQMPVGEYVEIQPGGPIPGGLIRGMFGDGSRWVPYIQVADLEGFTARAKKLGANGVHELGVVPGMGRFSLLTDPSGAPFGLWQPNGK